MVRRKGHRDREDEAEDRWELADLRNRDLFDSSFPDFDVEFRRMRRFIENIQRRAMRGELGEPGEGGPFVYGFSMRTGPDGKPHIQEFGNTRPGGPPFERGQGPGGPPRLQAEATNEREPLTDILQDDHTISITLELPGVEKEDIDIDVTEKSVSLAVATAQRRYSKQILLPAPVRPTSARATYCNGILDLVLEKQAPSTPTSHKVRVK